MPVYMGRSHKSRLLGLCGIVQHHLHNLQTSHNTNSAHICVHIHLMEYNYYVHEHYIDGEIHHASFFLMKS